MNAVEATFGAAEFKAKCLDILDQLSEHKLTRVTVTKRGRPVAVLRPPDERPKLVHGFLKGSVTAPEGFDFTAPALDEPLDAELGILHR